MRHRQIPSAVRQARHERGLSLSRLGDMVGTTAATLSRVETWRQRPRDELIEALEVALGLTAGQILGFEPYVPRARDAACSGRATPIAAQ